MKIKRNKAISVEINKGKGENSSSKEIDLRTITGSFRQIVRR